GPRPRFSRPPAAAHRLLPRRRPRHHPPSRRSAMPEIRTVLYPTDFSESSEAALALARALARDYDARLVVLHAYPPEAAARADELRARLQDLVPDDRTVAVEYRAAEGPPAGVILRAAEEVGADLIVMGTHGRGGLRRAVLGSTAEEVSRLARCPVATVRPTVSIPREKAAGRLGAVGAAEPRPDDPYLDIGTGD